MGIRFGAVAVLLAISSVASARWENGDLIFQKSLSPQSAAIKEATGSEWTHVGLLNYSEFGEWQVIESRKESVVVTPIKKFIERGKDHEILVMRWSRHEVSRPRNWNRVLLEIRALSGRPYDLLFEWSDQAIYCSELVFKSFIYVFGAAPGKLQTFGELKLDGPEVQRLIQERIVQKGKALSLDEKIITPVSLLNSPELIPVEP